MRLPDAVVAPRDARQEQPATVAGRGLFSWRIHDTGVTPLRPSGPTRRGILAVRPVVLPPLRPFRPMRELVPLLIAHGAALVFLVTLAARIGVPVPAAPLLVVAGGVATAGQLSFAACLAAAVVANLLGDAVWYQAGRWRGHRVMKWLCRISLSPDTCVRQSEGILARWGGGSLVAAKFVPGVSVVAAPMAGALGMSWTRFVAFDLGAGLIWSASFMALGAVFAGQIAVVLSLMAEFGALAGVAVAVVLACLVTARYLRRRWTLRDAQAPRIDVRALRERLRRGEALVVIDVRSPVAAAHDPRRIPGALAATLAELSALAAGLPRDREIVLYCNCPNEVSALRGVRILADHGLHRTSALLGGLQSWVETEEAHPAPDAAPQPMPAASA
jgi:membrane protein DedA with SNARE-associated domain/rhodanese-related sulfurtransferase